MVLVDNSDTPKTTAKSTWSTGNITGQQGYDHRTHAARSGTDNFTWKLDVPADGTYQVAVKYPKASGAATSAPYTVTHGGGTANKSVGQNTGTGRPVGSVHAAWMGSNRTV